MISDPARPIRTRRLRPLLPCLLVLAATVAQAQSWPTFRGPSADGRIATGLPEGEGALRFRVRWKAPLGSGYSGVSVVDGTLVTAFAAGDRDVVVALDGQTGRERWRYDLAPRYRGHDGSHDGPISTVAIADGRVFALDPGGKLVALDLASGEALWDLQLKEDLQAGDPLYGFCTSPLIVGDVLVLLSGGEEGGVVGLDVATGDLRWRGLEDSMECPSPVLVRVDGQQQVLVLGARRLAGIDPVQGSVLWSVEHGGSGGMGADASSPLPLGDDSFLVKHDNSATKILAAAAGEPTPSVSTLLETRSMSRSYSPPTVWDGNVYGYTSRFLSALDPISGEELWRSRAPGDGFLIVVEGQLVILAKKGSLHLGPADPAGWTETDRIDLFDELAWTPPSFADGSLYLRSLGEIARVDLVRGTVRSAEAESRELPTVLADLARKIDRGEDPSAAVDHFLDERELPAIDGDAVLFLWRGEAQDVAIAGDMLGMRHEEPMVRLAGTDLWWWETRLDSRARMSYVFFVDYSPVVDPHNPRRIRSTVLGPDLNWFNWRTGEVLDLSWFAMPGGPGDPEYLAPRPAGAHGGRLDQHTVEMVPKATPGQSEPEPVAVTVKVWLPPGYEQGEERYPVAFIHNPFADEVGLWPNALDSLVGKTVTPLVVVMVEAPGNLWDVYDQYFIERVLPLVEGRYRLLQDRNARASIGMGFEGLNAATLAFGNPDRFGLLAIQSIFGWDFELETIRNALGETTADAVPYRIYLDWGEWDIRTTLESWDVGEFGASVDGLLRGRGWNPVGGRVYDSTDWLSWRSRTDTILETFFPLDKR